MCALEEYKAKRDFTKTSEPAPKSRRKTAKRNSSKTVASKSKTTAKTSRRLQKKFVIQKHAASRLHYDLRLEIDGVLKSWAIPKGPSLDPKERRLAVHVEDHPIEYGTFEGSIPAGEYGAGEVIVWDRGKWKELDVKDSGYDSGKLKFELKGEKLNGGWTLVRMAKKSTDRQENWLLIKEKDEFAVPESKLSVTKKFPLSVKSGKDIKDLNPSKASSRSKSKRGAK